MMKLSPKITLLASILATPSLSFGIFELASLSDFGGVSADNDRIWGFTIDGDTIYAALNGSGPRVVALSDVSTTPSLSTIAPSSEFNGFLGPQFGFGLNSSGDLQFADTSTERGVLRLPTSGGVSTYVSQETIDLYIFNQFGETSASQIRTANTIIPGTDEMAFYDGRSDSILATSSGGLVTIATEQDLLDTIGTDNVGGGLAISPDGLTAYFGSSTTDDLYEWDILAGTATVLADFTSYVPGDILYAPDGWIYFYDGSSDSIQRVLPGQPGTLQTFVTDTQLEDAVGTDVLSQLGWYNGELAFITNRSGDFGVYVVPEPSVLGLFGLGALGLFLVVRRRR